MSRLDAVPAMSGDVWAVILQAFTEREGRCRVLEWGSGSSTLALVKRGLEKGKEFTLVSIDHDARWHETVLEAMVRIFEETTSRIVVSTSAPVCIPLPDIKSLRKEIRSLENEANFLYAAGDDPNIRRSRGYLCESSISRLCWRLMKNRLKSMLAASAPLMAEVLFGQFLPGGLTRRSARAVRISGNGAEVSLYFVPPEARGAFSCCTYDGLAVEFYRYITVPLPHKQYEMILIDGRARASCLKRVWRDNMLNDGGHLFVHDSYRHAYWSAFQLFPHFCLVDGNGQRSDGRAVKRQNADRGEGEVRTNGKIVCELFVHKKGD